MSKPSGGPAFPYPEGGDAQDQTWRAGNLTVRDHACIQLRVPDTGKPWLDEIISKARRDWFVGQAIQTLTEGNFSSWADIVKDCFGLAAAMLKATEPPEEKP